MDPIASVSGLATGIDFRGLVDQIIAAESRPLRNIESQIARVAQRSAAWEDFRLRISDLKSAASKLSAGTSFSLYSTSVASGQGVAPFSVSAKDGAALGSFDVEVLNLATREKLGSATFGTRSEALSLSGEFLAGGKAISIADGDSLNEIASQINAANTGQNPSGVSATIVQTTGDSYRLVLTSAEEGKAGINLVDGADGILRGLGVFGVESAIKNATSDGALGDRFLSQVDPVADQLAFSVAPAAGTVTLGSLDVVIDLSTMSLDDIATAINDAATVAGSGVSASISIDTDSDGTAYRRLDISGATTFTDAGGILEAVGIATGSLEAVAQQVESGVFTDGDDSTLATATTALANLYVDGDASGVQVGDTLTFNGTRGDGSTFTKTYTVASGDDFQDVLDSLNSAVDGFQAGTETATAAIVDGKLVVTDGTGGDSRLGISIVSNNEGGGSLDFGAFTTSETGRDRQVVAGVDAQLVVDGNYVTRTSNSVANVIDGVVLNLQSETLGAVTATVAQDTEAIKAELNAFVEAYNDITQFVNEQFSGGESEGGSRKPLSGDVTVRQMRNQMRQAMNTLINPAIGQNRGLFSVGIEIDRQGIFSIDDAKLEAALKQDATSVERLFSEYGAGSVGALSFVLGPDDLAGGDYDVNVTVAPTRAVVTTSGFGGTYVDDGTPDILTVTDTGSDYDYSIELSNGMDLDDIVTSLNAELGTKRVHIMDNDGAMNSDASGTVATTATTLDSLYSAGGAAFGMVDGDVVTLSGIGPDGISFFKEFAITDITTQTVGDLESALSDALSGQANVVLGDGRFQIATKIPGQSFLTISISSNNTGGGSFDLGVFTDAQKGRGISDLSVTAEGGELRIAHTSFGSDSGIDIAFTAGGADGTGSLGIAAGLASGTDIEGTINGLAAIGTGSVLRGEADTDVEGLQISYKGTDIGAIGFVTFSRGVGAAMEDVATRILGSGFGSIDSVVGTLDEGLEAMKKRLLSTEARLDRRRENLIKRFAKLEEAVSIAQSQGDFLTNQLSALKGLSSNNR